MKQRISLGTWLLLLLLTGCATPLAKMPEQTAGQLCRFLQTRLNQGDFLRCALGARRAASRDPHFGEAISPRVTVEAEIILDEYGRVARVTKMVPSVPAASREAVARCYEAALHSASVPSAGRRVRIPIHITLTPGEPPPPFGVDGSWPVCFVDQSAGDL